MPTLNRIRLVNIKYNDDKRIVRDDILNIDGENTLSLLKNAGGKSVLTKFLMQPIMWVYDKYPVKANPPYFDMRSYFRTNTEPCYVFLELKLEGDGGYLLLISGIAKGSDETSLKKIAFVHHYNSLDNEYSIHNFPLFFKNQGKMKLYGLDELYNKIKKESSIACFRNNSEHKRNFKELLLEYHINIKEWEKIHSRIVSMEGGLSEVFANSSTKTTKDLLNNWILESIEGKLDSEENDKTNMERIRETLKNHVLEKIDAKNDLRLLSEYSEFLISLNVLLELVTRKESTLSEKQEVVSNLVNMYVRFQQIREEIESTVSENRYKIKTANENIKSLSFQELSYKIYQETGKLTQLLDDFNDVEENKSKNQGALAEINAKIVNLQARQFYDSIMELQNQIDDKILELNPEKEKEYEEKTRNLQYTIKTVCWQELDAIESELEKCNELIQEYEKSMVTIAIEIEQTEKSAADTDKEMSSLKNKMYLFETEKEAVFSAYPDIPPVMLNDEDYIEDIMMDEYLNDLTSEQAKLGAKKEQIETGLIENSKMLKDQELILVKTENDLKDNKEALERKNQEYDNFCQKRDSLINHLGLYHFKPTDINDIGSLLNKLKSMVNEKEEDQFKLKLQFQELGIKFNFYKNDKIVINSAIERVLRQNNVDFYYGLEFIKRSDLQMEEKVDMIRKMPLLPYALVVTAKDYSKVKNILHTEFTDSAIPILVREKLDRYELVRTNSLFEISEEFGLFGGYNEKFIDATYIRTMIETVEKNIEILQGKIDSKTEELDALRKLIIAVTDYPYTPSSEKQFLGMMKELDQKAEQLRQCIDGIKGIITNINEKIESDNEELPVITQQYSTLIHKISKLKDLYDKRVAYFADRHSFEEKYNLKSILAKSVSDNRKKEKKLIEMMTDTKNRRANNETLADNIKVEDAIYLNYSDNGELVTNEDGVVYTKGILKESLRSIQTKSEFANIAAIKKDIEFLTRQMTSKEEDLRELKADKTIYTTIKFSKETLRRFISEREDIKDISSKLNQKATLLDYQMKECERIIGEKEEECLAEYGKEYDRTIRHKNFQQAREIEIKNIAKYGDEIKELENHIHKLSDMILDLGELETEAISEGTVLVQISVENYQEVFSNYKKALTTLTETLKSLELNIKELLLNANVKFVEKLGNEVISRFVSKIDNADSELLRLTIKKFMDKIEFLKERENHLAKQFADMSGLVQDYTSKTHQELQKIDKNSRIDPKGKKLFELSGIAKEGMKESLEEYLLEIINDIVEGVKTEDYINKAITTYNLLDAFISLDKVQANVIKFNLYDEVKVRFEETYNGGQCSGAQRMIIAFIILKSIMYYTSEGVIANNKESTSFMFLDNPFGVLSTKELLEIFYKIAKKFNTTLYSWTDAYKPEIISQHNVIYYFKLVQVGMKEYVTVTDKRDTDFFETINLDYIKQTSEQMSLDFDNQ